MYINLISSLINKNVTDISILLKLDKNKHIIYIIQIKSWGNSER